MDAEEPANPGKYIKSLHTGKSRAETGASRTRPELARLVREMKAGDVLKVVRIDRLARSVSHLLEVIEPLEKKGAHFRSLRDPIDTTTA